MPVQIGSQTIDGTLADWTDDDLLYVDSGPRQYALYGAISSDGLVFAISGAAPIGENTTIWLDTDLDRSTGHQIWGFAGGADYNIEIAADGTAALYTGAAGDVFIADLEIRYNDDATVAEVAVPLAAAGITDAVRVYADINNEVFLPGDYSNVDLIVGNDGQTFADPVAVGALTLDGDLTDWEGTAPLFIAEDGSSIQGQISEDSAVFALTSPVPIGAATTIWLDTDLDRSTGHQIWGFAGGADYNIEIAADGTAALYTGAAGDVFVAALEIRYNDDATVAEVAVPLAAAGITDAVRVYADINNEVFLPGDYSNVDLIVGNDGASPSPQDPVDFGPYTIDGELTEYAAETLLYTDGIAFINGDVVEEGLVIGLSANVPIGGSTTIWLDTDLDLDTGYQVFGSTAGADYNIEISADGTAALYTGGAGETFVGDVDIRYSDDGQTAEIAVNESLAEFGAQVRIFADINDSVFLPGDYASGNLIAGTPDLPPGSPDLKVGIVYSETSAENYFNLTNYGQLVMSAQNQAMQAGIPFDLLGEADLTDAARLAEYDALVFPGFANVQTSQLSEIKTALDIAVQSGTGIVAAGNFMTNDETGAALPGNSYAQMQSLLGVTLDGFGQTEGVEVFARDGGNPILDEYDAGGLVDSYDTLTSYVNFRDVTGTGSVLFDQITTLDGVETSHEAVIATEVAGNRNVHFATDAVIGNSNILHEAIDWIAKDDPGTADVALQMSRNPSLFYSRNDMDLSQEFFDVAIQDPGIYDSLNAILADWLEKYNFVGSYYINVGANPPDQQTDWAISGPLYQDLLAMGNEIGTHSYTHPDDTNLLDGDSPELLALLELVDPRNPDSIDPWDLTAAEQDILLNSYRFQFETSAFEIEQKLGIEVTGAAVPGAPETLDTSHEIIRFFDYMSGGYSGEGAGYPGAFGYLTPDLQDSVYLAPNMSFDFSLIQFQDKTPEEAAAIWAEEFADITTNGATPIIAFPWHDYGPTEWRFDGEPSSYTFEMFDNFLASAYEAGTEFVTGQDLADRIATFEDSELTLSRTGDVLAADVVSGDAAGRFALDVGEQIASVSGWYAWDDSQVFLPQNGGQFEVTLGAVAEDVTRLTALPDRADLVSVTGDGRALQAVIDGGGVASLNLGPEWDNDAVIIRGADGATNWTGSGLDLVLDGGVNELLVDYVDQGTGGTMESEIILGGSAKDVIDGSGGADWLLGGAGKDSFVLGSTSAGSVVLDFQPSEDTLVFASDIVSDLFQWSDEVDALNDFVNHDGDVRLMDGDTVFLTLVGVSKSELEACDVTFA